MSHRHAENSPASQSSQPTTRIVTSVHGASQRSPELGDFTADIRLLSISGLALVVGVLCAFIADGLMTLIGLITTNHWRLPVVERDAPTHLVGLLTQRDLLRARERLLNEERQRERVLHLRMLTPRARRAASTPLAKTDVPEDVSMRV